MALDPDTYRKVLRRFATGVTIVTVRSGDAVHGMTATAFASVSLEPPLVLVCLARTSRTRNLVLERGEFVVNILSEEHAEIAAAFARVGEKSFGDSFTPAPGSGAPVLSEAVATLTCRVEQVVEAGDHDVVIALVTDAASAGGRPLIYHDGGYRRLSSE